MIITLNALNTQYPKFEKKAGQDSAFDLIRLDQREHNMQRIATMAMSDYIPAEGARSLLRAISSRLLDDY